MALFSFTNVAVCLAALWLARRVYWQATTGALRRSLAKQHGCLPARPKPAKWGFLGLDHLVQHYQSYKEHRLMETLRNTLNDNGAHTLWMSVLGQQVFLTDDAENVKTLLSTNFDHWSIGRERITQISTYLGNGIFTTEGPAWKHSREMLRPCFERSQVADVSILEKHTNRFIKLLPKDSTTFDLQPLLQKLTLDIATEFLFGRSTNSLDQGQEDKACEEFVRAFEYCQNPLQGNEGLGILGMFLPDPKIKKCAKVIRAFADKIIEEETSAQASRRKETESTRYVFLDELLSMTEDRSAIRSELLNILLAGRDTTAALLSNVLFEIPRHPDVLARLRREIVERIGDEIPTYEQLKDMKYLRAIINETQRLYPIVPSNSREAVKDTILPHGGGPDGNSPILVPKGAYVMFHSYAMHRRPDIYGTDADSFDPTRWLDCEHPSPPLRPGWAYIPFNGGPRVCIGQNFALTEASFVLVRLLQAFEIESRDDEPWREKLSLTCTGLGGCKVALKPSQ